MRVNKRKPKNLSDTQQKVFILMDLRVHWLKLIYTSGSGFISSSDGCGSSASNVSHSPWNVKLNSPQKNGKATGGQGETH